MYISTYIKTRNINVFEMNFLLDPEEENGVKKY